MANHWDQAKLDEAWTARGLDRRQLLKLLGAGAGLSALTALFTAPDASAQEAGPGKIVVEWRKPQTLNGLFSTAGFEQQVERAVMGTLVTMSDVLVPTPDLAAKVDVSPDNTVFTFTLRDGLTFSDGTPLTSDDVLFTFTSALTKAVGSIWTGRLQGIKGAPEFTAGTAKSVAGLEAPDAKTFRITLSGPDSAFLPILADFSGLGILPKHILGSVAPDQLVNNPFNLAPTTGAGAFTFVRYETDQFVELAANPNYWGGAPKVSSIFLRILQADIAVGELEKGTLDLLSVSVDDLERLASNDAVTTVSVESPSLDSVSLNLDKAYFKDKRIRQALTYAIDRANIVKEIFKGKATVRNSPIFGPEWMGVPEGLNTYDYNPDTAKQLLSDAGWDSGRTVQMMYNPATTASFNNMIPILQQQWADVGFKVDLLQLDAAGINQKLITTGDYEIYIGGGGVYGADPNISSKYYLSNAFTPNGGNSVHYANPQVDALYKQGREASDHEARKKIYTELAKLLNDECPSVFLWSPNTNFAFSKRLQGFLAPHYVDNRLYSAARWSTSS